jgi:transglutaminase-like putative cysteine protease
MHQREDYYGNSVASFELFEKHEQLEISGESVVEVLPAEPDLLSGISWEDARQALNSQTDWTCIEASEFIHNSPHVSVTPQLDEYARKSFVPGRPLLGAVQDLMHRIHGEFKYRPQSTSIGITLAEVMRHRRGVCQDFAHVMIGALRSQRLAARYVSGYVRPGPKVQGAQASHAWASIFFPGTGWLSFDPTNDLMVSDSHVTLAWGRDYGDVTPVKGISLGGGGQSVRVEVYVRTLQTA